MAVSIIILLILPLIPHHHHGSMECVIVELCTEIDHTDIDNKEENGSDHNHHNLPMDPDDMNSCIKKNQYLYSKYNKIKSGITDDGSVDLSLLFTFIFYSVNSVYPEEESQYPWDETPSFYRSVTLYGADSLRAPPAYLS